MFASFKRWIRNRKALGSGFVALWVDDLRPAPEGWYHALDAAEGLRILMNYYVLESSFDHDLGDGPTGYDMVLRLVRYKEENGISFWPLIRPQVHSANPVGRSNMLALIDRYGPYKERQ
jgi:hypothetical protein